MVTSSGVSCCRTIGWCRELGLCGFVNKHNANLDRAFYSINNICMAILVPTVLLGMVTFSLSSSVWSSSQGMVHGFFSVFSWYLDGNFHFSTPLTTSLSWCIYLIWMVILMCTVQFLDGKFSLSYQMSFLYLADIWMATFILVCNEHNS